MFWAYDITSCDLSCDCNVICLFIVNKKEKEKEIQKKRNIKLRKINKRKMLVSKVFHNNKVILSGMKHIWKKKCSTEKSIEDVKRV